MTQEPKLLSAEDIVKIAHSSVQSYNVTLLLEHIAATEQLLGKARKIAKWSDRVNGKDLALVRDFLARTEYLEEK